MLLTLTFNFNVKCNSLRSPPSPAFGGLSRRERRKSTYARGLILNEHQHCHSGLIQQLHSPLEHHVAPFGQRRHVVGDDGIWRNAFGVIRAVERL